MGCGFYPDETYLFAYDSVKKTDVNEKQHFKALQDKYLNLKNEFQNVEYKEQPEPDFGINHRYRTIEENNDDGGTSVFTEENHGIEEIDTEYHSNDGDDNTSCEITNFIEVKKRNDLWDGSGIIGSSPKFSAFVTVTNDWKISVSKSIESCREQKIPSTRDKNVCKKVYAVDRCSYCSSQCAKCSLRLPLYHEQPLPTDFLGVWVPEWTKKHSKCPANGIMHYGHAALQKQPNFYNSPYSEDIWKLPGVNDEWLANATAPIDLRALYNGEMSSGLADISYTDDESLKFTE